MKYTDLIVGEKYLTRDGYYAEYVGYDNETCTEYVLDWYRGADGTHSTTITGSVYNDSRESQNDVVVLDKEQDPLINRKKNRDLINAWINGAVIETNYGNDWFVIQYPEWDSAEPYRIKETPIVHKVWINGHGAISLTPQPGWSMIEISTKGFGETLEIDSTEVIKKT